MILRQTALSLMVLLPNHETVASPDFKSLEKSIVRVVTQTTQGFSTGTGFAVSSHGHIVTNAHVVEDGVRIAIIPTNSTVPHESEIIAISHELDLAILRAPTLLLTPLTLSITELLKGQKIWAIGYPGGADRERLADDPTVQDGVIGRTFRGTWDGRPFTGQLTIVQHNAPSNPGNSGGPLLDDCGQTVGVNTQASLVLVNSPQAGMERIPHTAGIYWSSHVDELAGFLDEHAINYESKADPCTPETASAVTPASSTGSLPSQQGQSQASDDTELFLVWGLILGSLCAAVLLIVRKKRKAKPLLTTHSGPKSESTMNNTRMNNTSEESVREPRPELVSEQTRLPDSGLVLAGFNTEGIRVRIALPRTRFTGQKLGLSLGRHPELVDVTVSEQSISRRHARISVQEGELYIEDLNSRNGTSVEDVRLSPFEPVPLRYGSLVRLGDLELRVSKED